MSLFSSNVYHCILAQHLISFPTVAITRKCEQSKKVCPPPNLISPLMWPRMLCFLVTQHVYFAAFPLQKEETHLKDSQTSTWSIPMPECYFYIWYPLFLCLSNNRSSWFIFYMLKQHVRLQVTDVRYVSILFRGWQK